LRHTILGFFFFTMLAVLGYLTIYLGGWHPLQHPILCAVYIDDADGLGPGDPVWVNGVSSSGRVDEIQFVAGNPPPERRLRVTFTVTAPVVLCEDYSILIGSQSLLGGKQLNIDPGTGKPLAADRFVELKATSEGNLLRSFSRIVGQNEHDIRRIVNGVAEIVDGVKSGNRDLLSLILNKQAYADVNGGIASARSILDKADHGEGSVAMAINKPDLHDSIKGFTDAGRTLLNDIQTKKGPLNQLIYDEATGAKLKEGIEGLAATAKRLGEGQGLLGKATMPESEATWTDLKGIVADGRDVMAQVRSGKGAIGKLVYDPDVEKSVTDITSHFAKLSIDVSALASDARRGRGVLGLLVADDEARRTFERLINQLSRAVEDAREAAPVSSVASFLFGQL
jgi:phospholipid/cholesterol/gamma-HCH transport system substrate-binding protein